MTGLFGFRVRYSDGMEVYTPFLPAGTLAEATEVEPVVFTAKPPFCIDDRSPSNLVVRRDNAPEDVWWHLTQAIQLGLAATAKEWTREVPGREE